MSELTDRELAKLGKRRWSEREARRVLVTWRVTGESLAGFGRRHGLRPQRLSWWSKRLADWREEGSAKSTSGPGLVPAVIRGGESVGLAPTITLRMRSGIALEISDPSSVAPSWLGEVARELARAD